MPIEKATRNKAIYNSRQIDYLVMKDLQNSKQYEKEVFSFTTKSGL